MTLWRIRATYKPSSHDAKRRAWAGSHSSWSGTLFGAMTWYYTMFVTCVVTPGVCSVSKRGGWESKPTVSMIKLIKRNKIQLKQGNVEITLNYKPNSSMYLIYKVQCKRWSRICRANTKKWAAKAKLVMGLLPMLKWLKLKIAVTQRRIQPFNGLCVMIGGSAEARPLHILTFIQWP